MCARVEVDHNLFSVIPLLMDIWTTSSYTQVLCLSNFGKRVLEERLAGQRVKAYTSLSHIAEFPSLEAPLHFGFPAQHEEACFTDWPTLHGDNMLLDLAPVWCVRCDVSVWFSHALLGKVELAFS